MPIERVLKAIDEIKKGRMVILSDDEDRENEGDLTMAAEMVTPEAINFMAKYGRGLICLSLTEEKCRELDLPMMVQDNTSSFQTGFTVSIDVVKGGTTGISAADRALTILTAVKDGAKPEELGRPGHIFPLRSLPGGVLRRTGQTEGSVDLCRLAGLKPAGIICEIMNDDGTMSRMPELKKFAKEHDAILFVSGRESSNGQALFKVCKEVNPDSHFITKKQDVDMVDLKGKTSVGISGATSTPGWLIRDVEERLNKRYNL